MPRNPAGTYTFPALGNPAVTNTPITIAWWNGTYVDVATALTNSFDRTGATGGMTGQFKSVDGSAGSPGLTFGSDSTTGFSITTPGELDVSISGALVSRWTSAGFQGTFDAGSTWKTPVYRDVASQSMGATGALDFAAGKLTIASVAVHAQPTVTKATTSTGTFTTSSATFAAVTNANISFTATGGPVLVQLVPDDTSNESYMSTQPTGAVPALGTIGSGNAYLALSADAGSTFFARTRLISFTYSNGVFWIPINHPVSAYSTWYTPGAGAATIGLYVHGDAGTTSVQVFYSKLLITQF